MLGKLGNDRRQRKFIGFTLLGRGSATNSGDFAGRASERYAIFDSDSNSILAEFEVRVQSASVSRGKCIID